MEKEFFDLLGLGVPFYLGAATSAVFAWLDNNASNDATKVISSWLHGRSPHKPDLGNLIINAFDRIYTSPLLTFRAFRRSAAISSIIWLLIFFVPYFVRLATYLPAHRMLGLSVIQLALLTHSDCRSGYYLISYCLIRLRLVGICPTVPEAGASLSHQS
jgi:hypothetical protein